MRQVLGASTVRTVGRVVGVAAAVLVVAATAGCGVLDRQPPAASTPAPVGTCFDLRYLAEVTAVSLGAPAVDCDDEHTLQVSATTELTGSPADQRERPTQQVLQRLTSRLCGYEQARAFVGAAERDGVVPLATWAYWPTAAEWADGDRAVTCAVGLVGTGGGPRTVTRSLEGVLPTRSSADVRQCYRQQARPDGTWEPTGTAVPCSAPHSSQDVNAWLDVTTGDPTQQDVERMCSPFVGDYPTTFVTGVAVQQTNGTHSLHCAVGGDSRAGLTTGAFLPTSRG